MKTGIVSFSLFGSDPNDIYHQGACEQSRLYKKHRPDWSLWFYVGKSVPNDVLQRICEANPRAVIQFVDEPEDLSATWWRYRAPSVTGEDFVLFRDTDCRLNVRELEAVDEWLEQDQFQFHMMRDHPAHGVPLLAGLLGVQRAGYHRFNDLPKRLDKNHYQCDQDTLTRYLWPVVKRSTMVHIGCYHLYEKPYQRRPFRTRRPGGSFVGEGFYGNGKPRFPEHRSATQDDYEFTQHPMIFTEEYRVPSKNPPGVFLPRA